MTVVVLFLLGLIITSIQSSFIHALSLPDELKAPLAITFIPYAAFHLERIRALILSFLVGYIMDVFSGGLGGVMPLSSVVLCLTGFWLQRGFLLRGTWAIISVGFAFAAAFSLFTLGLEALFGVYRGGFPLREVIIQSAMVGLLSPPLVLLAGKIQDLTIPHAGRP
jgi:rod shape-determining protein MreD